MATLPLGNGVDWQVVECDGPANKDTKLVGDKKQTDKDGNTNAKSDWEVVQEDNENKEESNAIDNSKDNNENNADEEVKIDMYWITKELLSMYHQQSSPTECYVTSSFSRGR